jgi:DMSO/TMAO reductase YedYZ molybdopterin-dependent catalytic subunit
LVYHRVISEQPANTGVKVEGLTGESLNQRQMFERNHFLAPISPPGGFELAIPDKKSKFITIEQFTPFERVERDLVLECAGNGRSLMKPPPPGTQWALDGVSAITVGGYRLNEVLGTLPSGVIDVVFTGADIGTVAPEGRIPYQFSISRELAMSNVPLLVTHIGGEPLTLAHGAPIRLVVPGHYAMMSVKWLIKVEAVSEPFHGHFVDLYRYFDDDFEDERSPVGPIAVRSIISSPLSGESVSAGALEIKGSAWSGTSEVAMVEVSVDGGTTWDQADLVRRQTGGRWAPIRWAYTAEPEAGLVEIVVRASDESGAVQPLRPRWNTKGYANNVAHRIRVRAVEP